MKRNKGDQCFDSLPVIRSLSFPWCLAIRWLWDAVSARDVQFIPTLCWIIAYLQLLVNESQNIKRKRVLGYKFMTCYYSSLSAMSFKYEKILLFLSSSAKISYSEVWCRLFRLCLNFSLQRGIIVSIKCHCYYLNANIWYCWLSICLIYISILYVIHTVHFLIISMLSNQYTRTYQ